MPNLVAYFGVLCVMLYQLLGHNVYCFFVDVCLFVCMYKSCSVTVYLHQAVCTFCQDAPSNQLIQKQWFLGGMEFCCPGRSPQVIIPFHASELAR